MSFYNHELHIHEDPSFPVIFHMDYSLNHDADFLIHWHESIEILHVLEGSFVVVSDTNQVIANKGDIAIINSGNIHNIKSITKTSKYDCLIIEKNLCEEFGISIEEIVFQRIISDKEAKRMFLEIKNEMISKKSLYKSGVKISILSFMVYLYRNYLISQSPFSNKAENIKISSIKKSIKFIQDNYNKNISTSDIAKEIGLSKYYFCRTFSEITCNTAVYYINHIRCTNAKSLLQSGKYTVSEVALLCGFDNLSYFSKTYKKHIGCLPSENKKCLE